MSRFVRITPGVSRTALALLCGLALASCAGGPALQDDGKAPVVTAPPVAQPLWPGFTPPPPPYEDGGGNAYSTTPFLFTMPPGGLTAVDPVTLLLADPNLGSSSKQVVSQCGKGTCGVRPAVFRDLTGEGVPELIAAVDLPQGQSLIVAYRNTGDSVRPILIERGPSLNAETLGHDILVRSAATRDTENVTRFHWNGELMARVRLDVRPLPGVQAAPTLLPRTTP